MKEIKDLTGNGEFSEEMRELFKYLLEEESGVRLAETPTLAPRDESAPLLLSFTQQRLWFLDQLEPGNTFYSMPAAFRLSGNLDANGLERSLDEIVRRHEILRTTFVAKNGEPLQSIQPATRVDLPLVDLSTLPEAEREDEAKRLASIEAAKPFDLSTGPLFRASLLRLAADEHILLVNMHHIISDGWSIGVLMEEMSALYHAFSTNSPSPLPELPIQYADFALWQRRWLQGEELEKQLAFWKSHLHGELPVLNLPTSRPHPKVQTYCGDTLSADLPKELLERLRLLGQEEGATLFITLLAGFQVLLHKYSGQTDFIIGTPVAGRNRSVLESLIGFFVNTLPLRCDLSRNPTFRELLADVRETTLSAFAHQDVPFEKLVEEIAPERDMSYSPIFQVMFVLENAAASSFSLSGLEIEPLELESKVSKFDLTLSVEERSDGLRLSLEYNTDLFDAEAIERMLVHLRELFAAIAATPERRLSELSLLSPPERHYLLYELNDTARPYPAQTCLHTAFEQQAGLTPDAVAVSFGECRLTYAELDRRANQLAHYLRARGAGAEKLVGVCLPRTADMIVALLGILKAGAAYVPLDPRYPKDRLAFMLNDAGAVLWLTQRDILELLPEHAAQVICIDDEREAIEREPQEPPVSRVMAANPAYVLYTSGSTGRPKGIAIEHASSVAMIAWAREVYTKEELAGVLASTSISFDISVFEIFLPLSCGGRIILVENVLHLPETPDADQVTLVNTVPSAMLELLRVNALPASVKTVNLAGEPLKHALAQDVYRQPQVERLYNLYGPSEDTTYTTFSLVEKGGEHAPNIGRPIFNTQIYLLDKHLQPVPTGVAGEIHIAGAGLARGYLNRPELTAEKFIPNHIGDAAGARLYKTGDLARYLPNGELEFLGRLDNQVKLRGFRIELDEIEALLDRHPAVRENAVIIREDVPGDKRIVAYLAVEPDADVSTGHLRDFVRAKLPEHMVPSAFVLLDELPLTPNGKINRRALAALPHKPDEREAGAVAPRSATEELLAGIWSQVLGVERPGVQQNFFELGGHSLLATQVVSRIHDTLNLHLPVRKIFEAPTIAELAAQIEAARSAENGLELPPIRKASHTGVAPLSFAQRRLWFIDQLQPGNPAYNIPVAIRIQGALSSDIMERCLREIISRHEILRTTFEVRNGEAVQAISPDLNFELQVCDLSATPEANRADEALKLAREEARAPFALNVVPLFRIRLLRFSQDDHVLLVNMHHIISDAWSLGILLREVAGLYEAYETGEQPRLPALEVQYSDYAVWQQEWFRGETSDRQLAYWKEKLDGNLPVLNLLTDRPRPATLSQRGASLPLRLNRGLSENLKRFSERQGATLFMTLFGAFNVLLHRYTGQRDIILGTSIAGRNHAEIENLIGLFVNLLAIRTQMSETETFLSLLGKVRENTLGAYAHQDIPFEEVVEALVQERDTSRAPLAQAMFVLLNNPMPDLDFAGLSMSSLEIGGETSKVDFSLILEDTGEGLVGMLEYSTDLFNGETMARLFDHYRILLEDIVENPQKQLSQLRLLEDSERRRLLEEWNLPDVTAAAPDVAAAPGAHEKQRWAGAQVSELAQTVPSMFEQQAANAPDAAAVITNDRTLTFRELNEAANRLAHHLREKYSVQPGEPVGLMMTRSELAVIALLGILKAGGAYVPVDPSYSPERMERTFNDVQLKTLLIESEFMFNLPEFAGQVFVLDVELDMLDTPETNPLPVNQPTDLAYILYTSGSTGQPKGVPIPHRAIVRLVSDNRYVTITGRDRVAQAATITFDAATFEIWGALLHGAATVIIPKETALSPPALAKALETHGVTVMFLTTSLFNRVARELPSAFKGLKTLLTGGEAADARWMSEVLKAAPQTRLLNVYGPTECTTFALWHPLGDAPVNAGGSVPIGRPLAYTSVYVLDAQLNPVPVGVPGELHLGGAGLALGYWNQADAAAEKFIPNPFDDGLGDRLYKTGDLVRYLPGGQIEFLGRVDHQIKIRGFRVELGEIETALREHPNVLEAVAVLEQDAGGEKRIVAYVQVREGAALTVLAVRAFLQEKLPDYMVPAVFVALNSMPVNAVGKIDRDALPQSDSARMELGEAFEAPRTETEKILADIWREVLGLEQIGINDNYFALGGDSILSIKVVTEAKERGLSLPLVHLFKYQTISELAAALEHGEQPVEVSAPRGTEPFSLISPEDRELLPADVEDAYPLAMLQAGMLFHSSFENSSAYHDIFTYRIHSHYDFEKLTEVFNQVVAAHPVLRTSFHLTGFSEPLQLVHSSARLPVEETDLSALNEAQQDAAIQGWFEAEKQRPFDWHRPPLFNVNIFRRGTRDFEVGLSFHHALLDGWSFSILLAEIALRYQSKGEPSIGEQPLQATYRDYIALEREALRSPESEQFWQSYLDGFNFTQVPRLPNVKRVPHYSQLQVARGSVGEEVARKLSRLAQEWEVPIKSLLLSVHLRVLGFISNQREVVTGLVSNGRTESGNGDRVLGMHLNTLPLRMELRDGSWRELCSTAFQAERQLLPQRRYPLAQIQRIVGGQSLFETAFNFLDFHRLSNSLKELDDFEIQESRDFTEGNFTLTTHFSINRESRGIDVILEGNTAELTQEQLEAVARYYTNCMEALAHHPETGHSRVSLMTAQERQFLLEAGNATRKEFAQDALINALFEEQAARTPDSVAVSFEEERMSYGELNRRANQLAHYLRKINVRPEVRVGLLMERSSEMIVGLLGILKAGGAYVPLDPAYPDERLQFIMDDAAVEVLVTQARLIEALPAAHSRQIICVDTQWEMLLAGESSQNPSAVATPENTAYVIYTSGSTGQPKGVLVPHSNVVRLLSATDDWFHFNERDVWTLFHSFAFDFSVWELWGALLYGARLVVVPFWVSRTPPAFYELLRKERVTVLNQTPSAFRQLMLTEEAAGLDEQLALRLVIFGGEALDFQSLRPWFDRHGDEQPQLVNMYGITETTVHVTYRKLSARDLGEGQGSMIGAAIPDMQLYVLDEYLQPVPSITAGELYVGGGGLARGYLNRPALSAERFVPHPYSEEAGARLYRTGDLVRYLPNGELEYLGRIDQQVKIRGFRIELGEVEAVLNEHSAIRESVIVARAGGDGDSQLVAYVVPRWEQSKPTAGELRTYLKERLPEYMIPSIFELLDALPLTSHGKVNRKALPAPSQTRVADENVLVAPRNSIEEKLYDIWTKILKAEGFGVQNNFFELGGHSLLAMQLVARVESDLGFELPVRTIFEAPTIEKIAAFIEQGTTFRQRSPIVCLQQSADRVPFVCVHPAGGNIHSYLELAKLLGAEQPFYGVQARGLEKDEQPITNIEEMAALYVQELLMVQPEGPYLLGGWSFGGLVAFEMARQLRERGAEVKLVALIDSVVESPLEKADLSDSALLAYFAADVAGSSAESLASELDILAELPASEHLPYVWNQAVRLELLPASVTLAQFERLFEVFKSHLRARESYDPQPYDGEVTLLRAAEQTEEQKETQMMQWKRLALRGVNVHEVAGTHYTMMNRPHVEQAAALLARLVGLALKDGSEAV
jgi:amino acid adenylation domain-containing protein